MEAVTRCLLNSSLVHPREVFRAAVAWGDAGIILAHNHPSGDPTPSAEDRAATRQLVSAGQLLDLPVYDHIIVAGDRFVSLCLGGAPMSADYNGWQDQPETERESIEIWEASTTASLTPVMLYRIASNVSLSRARSAYDAAMSHQEAA